MDTSTILLVLVTLGLAVLGYLVLFKPGKKEKEEVLKEMTFDMDDSGWAADEEDKVLEDQAAAPLATGTGAGTAGAAIPNLPRMPAPAQHDPSLPFQVGDRIVLQNLVGAANLNGRHGVIGAVYDRKTQRYPVDLDLFHDKPLAVKEGNLLKEPTAVPAPEDMPNIINGCLEPAHAKTCGFIMHVLRKSCSQTLKGETNPLKLCAFSWQFWTAKDNSNAGVYPGLLNYLTKDILRTQKLTDLDKQVSADSEKPTPGAYRLVTKAMRSPQAVASWNVRVEGAFWIVGMGALGTMVVPCHNIRQVYIVVGFQAPLMAVAGGGVNKFPRPPKFHLILLPWFGVIVHDSFLSTTTGSNQVELASPELANQLIVNSKLAVAENRVITCLQQLHQDPPSQQGVAFRPPPMVNAPAPDPPTAEEKALVEQLAKITDIIPPPDGMWNFFRPPNPNQPNGHPQPMVVINAKSEKFAEFTPKASNADKMQVELLQQVLKLCRAREKLQRPAAIGTDNPQLCQRLQFLCHQMKDFRVLLLNVNVKKQESQPDPADKAAE